MLVLNIRLIPRRYLFVFRPCKCPRCFTTCPPVWTFWPAVSCLDRQGVPPVDPGVADPEAQGGTRSQETRKSKTEADGGNKSTRGNPPDRARPCLGNSNVVKRSACCRHCTTRTGQDVRRLCCRVIGTRRSASHRSRSRNPTGSPCLRKTRLQVLQGVRNSVRVVSASHIRGVWVSITDH